MTYLQYLPLRSKVNKINTMPSLGRKFLVLWLVGTLLITGVGIYAVKVQKSLDGQSRVEKQNIIEVRNVTDSIDIRIQKPYKIVDTLEPSEAETKSMDFFNLEPLVDTPKQNLTHDEKKRYIENNTKNPSLIKTIWKNETSEGRNESNLKDLHNRCRLQGESNEFGYAAHDGVCFKTFEDSVQRVDQWIADNREIGSDNRLLCYYNLGVKTEYCSYIASL